jgi:hypothetical protein
MGFRYDRRKVQQLGGLWVDPKLGPGGVIDEIIGNRVQNFVKLQEKLYIAGKLDTTLGDKIVNQFCGICYPLQGLRFEQVCFGDYFKFPVPEKVRLSFRVNVVRTTSRQVRRPDGKK